MTVDTPINHPNVTSKAKPARPGGLPSKRRRPGDPAKMTVHTTETPAGTGHAVARNLAWPYTLIVDPFTKEIIELLPLNYTAYSLRGTHPNTGAKVETNHSGRMHPQVSIVGYAREMHNLTFAQLDWLAIEVFKPIMDLCEIDNYWHKTYGANEGIVLASAYSSVRLPEAQCHRYSGVLSHQTWYGQDHWDPGKLNVTYIKFRLMGGPQTIDEIPTTSEGIPMAITENDIFSLIPGTVLKIGSSNSLQVAGLQRTLNAWFNATIKVDGDFGGITDNAVRFAQKKIGVGVDGVWGPGSHGALKAYASAIAEALVEAPATVAKDNSKDLAIMRAALEEAGSTIDNALDMIDRLIMEQNI